VFIKNNYYVKFILDNNIKMEISMSLFNKLDSSVPSLVNRSPEAEKTACQAARQACKEIAGMWRSVSYHFDMKVEKKGLWDKKEIMVIRPFVKTPDAEGFKKAEELGLPSIYIEYGEFDYMGSIAQCQRVAADIEAKMEKYFPEL
jgi:hypothetical protein